MLALLAACNSADEYTPVEGEPGFSEGTPGDAGNPGTGGNIGSPGTGENNQPAPSNPPYPEPSATAVDAPNARGFYDQDKEGNPRAVRNDLSGNFPAMVQFGQSHTIDPAGNEANFLPRLTSQREALLLVTPDPSLTGVTELQAIVTLNGVNQGNITLKHPNSIPRADHSPQSGRPDYVYSLRAWTGVLPWDWVQPGLEITVIDNQNRSGTLLSSAIEFGAAAELVVHNIRIGMLTTPEVINNGGQLFISHPAEAATDYFQTIPAAKLIAAKYEDVTLPQVMVGSGVIYDTASAGEGGVYGGDMRGDTAKSTFSVGINMANYGVTSSGMVSQQQPQVFQIVTAHHARGMYTNGQQSHGLSGGNSILTLWTSRGNEFSHEIGHHYGLGHYPGFTSTSSFLAGHHHDSGWGYMGHRKRMRSNILWNSKAPCQLNGLPAVVLADTYCFAPDSMSGGSFTSSLSSYTHYTGYSTQQRIQPALDKPVLSNTSATGYRKWNKETQEMQEFVPTVPNQNTVWFNAKVGDPFLKPLQQGVPVITLLGGYDPQSDKALMYPALRGNWGNVFALPATSATADTDASQCWMNVTFETGKAAQRIALAGVRMEKDRVNKFHVNLAQSDKPNYAALYCQATGAAERKLYEITIDTNGAPMPAAVIVGKEQGYAALRQVELPKLQAELEALANRNVLTLTTSGAVLLASYREYANEMSQLAQTQLARYEQQQNQGQRLNRWMTAYAQDLENRTPTALTAFNALTRELGIEDSMQVPAGEKITMPNGNCIQKFGNAVRVASAQLCSTDSTDNEWIVSASGSIHSRSDLGLCLTSPGRRDADITLSACNATNAMQAWDTSVEKRITLGNLCMDLNGGKLIDGSNKLITYGCSGASNQSWTAPLTTVKPALALLNNDNLRLLSTIAFSGSTAAPQ